MTPTVVESALVDPNTTGNMVMPEAHLAFDAFRLDPENACLWHHQRRIPLPPKAFETLRHLAEHAGRLVTKDELLGAVWPNSYVTDATLKVCIAGLRKVLGDRPRQPRFIETVHRRGYRFVAPAASIRPPSPARQCVATGTVIPTTGNRRRVFAGRTRELEILQNHLRNALEGEPQVVFVTGEPGIGKTALVEAFLEQASVDLPGVLFGRGQCVATYGEHEAYLPLLEALSALCRRPQREKLVELLGHYAPTWLAQIPWLMDAPQLAGLQRQVLGASRQRMLREMLEALWRLVEDTPLVLLLEDLHWSDGATVDLLSSLAQRRGAARLLVIGTYRPVELILRQHPLKAAKRQLLVKDQCSELALPFLSECEVSAYLALRFPSNCFSPQVAKALHDRTDGNPLFLVNVLGFMVSTGLICEMNGTWELVGSYRAIADTLPENIREMLEECIEGLATLPRTVLETASVVGMDFSSAVIAAVLGRSLVEVEACCQELSRHGQFLSRELTTKWPDGTVAQRYRFIHALYQQVFYQRLPGAQRAALHRAVGFSLERGYQQRTGKIAAVLAMHFEQGREPACAIRYLRQAASNAARIYANGEGIRYLDRAVHWAQQMPEPQRYPVLAGIRSERGALRRALGDMEGAAQDFAAVAEHLHAANNVEGEVRALIEWVIALSWFDRQQCLAVVDKLDAACARLTNPSLRAYGGGWRAYWYLMWEGWREADAKACALGVEAARQLGEPSLCATLQGRSSFFQALRSDYLGASKTAKAGTEAALGAGKAFEYMASHYFWAWALLHQGAFGELHTVLRRGIEMAEQNEHRLWALLFRLQLAWLYEQAHAFEASREIAAECCAAADRLAFPFGQLLSPIVLGHAWLGLEQTEPAYECFNGVVKMLKHSRPLQDWVLRMPLTYGLGRCWLRWREPMRASAAARELCAIAALPGERTYLALGHLVMAETAVAEKNWQQARCAIAHASHTLARISAPLAEWRVSACMARIHEQSDQWQEAGACWHHSAQVLGRLAASLNAVPDLRRALLDHPGVHRIVARAEQCRMAKDHSRVSA